VEWLNPVPGLNFLNVCKVGGIEQLGAAYD
jgi:hypothetical protein